MRFQAKLARTAHRIWNRKGGISTLLLPLSWLTRLVINQKSARYARRPGRVWHGKVPVVIVGNIYVGGTGKTPVVMALVEALEQRGWRPGVISRGYGVHIGEHARTGQGELDPAHYGDEPALIARSTQVPIAVHPSRPKAAQALLHDYPDLDVIVADDGLQHLALGRDAEIIVQDSRTIGNGRLLPAGPLREPASRLQNVDVIVTNEAGFSPAQPRTVPDKQPYGAPHAADNGAIPDLPIHVDMSLLPHEAIHLYTGRRLPWDMWMAKHRDAPVGAVAAIGNPERFFDMLRNEGLALTQSLGLPDHTSYHATSFDTIKTDLILITTKDAVKCAALHDHRLWAVRVIPQFSNTRWLDHLHTVLQSAARRKNLERVRHSTLN